ncbi:MAG: hypothetical protein RH917_15225 [Lacipirellulaceae bacterium]
MHFKLSSKHLPCIPLQAYVACWAVFILAQSSYAVAQENVANEPRSVLASAGYGPEAQLAQQQAWGEVSAGGVESIPAILGSLEGATPLGRNWLRTAADTIAQRHYQETGELPKAMLETFVTDRSQPPLGRRVAFEWLERVDPTAQERLLPQMLEDTSLDLRFEAVAQLIQKAEASSEPDQQITMLKKAFAAARDVQQIESLAEKLTELGSEADLIKQMGYVVDWQIVGPFDNTDLDGFAIEYGPEADAGSSAASLKGSYYKGKNGKVTWQPHSSKSEYGIIDLNEALENDKEVIAYAQTSITSEKAQNVELRLASKNALKVWLNGKQVGEFEIYHSGFAIDQYVVPVEFAQGDNVVLVKVCQNAKKMGWEKEWEFRLRITDQLGGAADLKQ